MRKVRGTMLILAEVLQGYSPLEGEEKMKRKENSRSSKRQIRAVRCLCGLTKYNQFTKLSKKMNVGVWGERLLKLDGVEERMSKEFGEREECRREFGASFRMIHLLSGKDKRAEPMWERGRPKECVFVGRRVFVN